MRPVRCLPNANKSVALSISHGITFKKVCAGVLIRRTAPASPPTTLVTIRGIITRREILSRFRYAPPLAVTPTQSASVFVAFADTGGTPVNMSAGNATKLPPPATALMAPPSAPAKRRNMALCKFKQVFYHVSRPALHSERNPIRTTGRSPPARVHAQSFLATLSFFLTPSFLPRPKSFPQVPKSFLDKPPRSVYVRSVS